MVLETVRFANFDDKVGILTMRKIWKRMAAVVWIFLKLGSTVVVSGMVSFIWDKLAWLLVVIDSSKSSK